MAEIEYAPIEPLGDKYAVAVAKQIEMNGRESIPRDILDRFDARVNKMSNDKVVVSPESEVEKKKPEPPITVQDKAAAASVLSEEQEITKSPGLTDEQILASAWNVFVDPDTHFPYPDDFVKNMIARGITPDEWKRESTSAAPEEGFEVVDAIPVDEEEIGGSNSGGPDGEAERPEEEPKGTVWYPELEKDILEATKVPRVENPAQKREDLDRNRQAALRLIDHSIKVQPLIEGDDDEKGRQRVILNMARRLVFEEVPEAAGGMKTEQAEKFLNHININVDRVKEEREKNKHARGPESETDHGPGAPESRIPTPEPMENTEKKSVDQVIRENERYYYDRFVNDQAIRLDGEFYTKIGLILTASGKNQDEIDRIVSRIRSMDTSAIEEVRLIYLREILPTSQERGVGKQDYLFEEATVRGQWRRAVSEAEKSRALTNLNNLTNEIGSLVTYVQTDRHWSDMQADMLAQFLQTRLKAGLVGLPEDETLGSTPFDKVRKYFSGVYSIKDNLSKRLFATTGGAGAVETRVDPEKEILISVAKLHDIAIEIDDAKTKDDIDHRVFTGFDAALSQILRMKDLHGKNIVAEVVVIYDQVLRQKSVSEPLKAVNIDDSTISAELRRKIKTRLRLNDPKEIELFRLMGRDLCRITGIDAQYGVSKTGVYEDGKIKRDKLEDVSGSVVRAGLNYEIGIKQNDDLVKAELRKHVDLGFVPFWNEMRELEQHESAPITVDQIKGVVDSKLLEGSSPYTTWANNLFSVILDAKVAEDKIIGNPVSIDAMISGYEKVYWYKGGSRNKYIQERISDLIRYYRDPNNVNRRDIKAVVNMIEKTFFPEGNFDGKGIYDSASYFKEKMKEVGLNINFQSEKIKKARSWGDKLADW